MKLGNSFIRPGKWDLGDTRIPSRWGLENTNTQRKELMDDEADFSWLASVCKQLRVREWNMHASVKS